MDEAKDARRMEELEGRLKRLERAARLWKAIGAGALALAAVAFLLSAPRSQASEATGELKAHRFTVIDKEGHDRGALYISEYGSLRLDLQDAHKVLRASLSVATSGTPSLDLYDTKGRERAGLEVLANGSSSLKLYDSGGLRAVLGRAKLEAVQSGKEEERPVSSLVLFDEEGRVLWRAPE